MPLALPDTFHGAKNITSIDALHNRVWAGSVGSAAWPSGNRALYMPVILTAPCYAIKIFTNNGGTASGNQDVGIYNASGTRLVSSTSTAQSGTNTLQVTDIADMLLVPGLYYLGLVNSGTTGTYHRVAPTAEVIRTWGVLQEALGSSTLPSSMSGATVASAYVPVCGISTKDPT